jgi:hypothetical protein
MTPVEREFDYLIWKAESLGQKGKARELKAKLEEYRILYKDGGTK